MFGSRQISWTASHVEGKARLGTLSMMIESLVANKVNVMQMSISTVPDMLELTKEFMDMLQSCYTNLSVTIHPKKMCQFDHLEYLYKNFDGAGDDMILFMDDDDLLLRNPHWPLAGHPLGVWQDHTVISSLQYIPTDGDGSVVNSSTTCNMNITNILELEDKMSHIWSHESDFSGYMARFSIVKQYFLRRSIKESFPESSFTKMLGNILENFEDTKFMNFLDEQPGAYSPIRPFVFHRLWQDSELQEADKPSCTWRAAVGLSQ